MTADARRVPRRKLPAFGRDLLDLRRRGLVPQRGFFLAHVLVVLDNWKLGRGFTRLVVAPDDDPAALDFSPVAGLEVIVIHDARRTAPARLVAAVNAVLDAMANELVVFDIAATHAPRIIRSPALGIERAKFP